MKVLIEDNLYLESDEKQFVIKKYSGKVDRDGKEQFQPKGYFSSIEGALNHLVKMKIKESTASTLSELVRDIQEIKAWISREIGV
ncbi:hypothetical protein EJP82_00975 [Paenibacillus anaericanus]|uniref:DUF5405 domain-containing protein n=1 Tax=Paenibacillus anaericanus TaxID=170367 RepID=A0A3S1DNM7_9BACL|nr:hypothetical protein [Paenibacillus anaericanus]RUT48548.1 hypothetical protein EJP82_00975 [Paenibacillus anaericanus]